MSTGEMNRRGFLGRGLTLGCSAAASPLLSTLTFASAPWDARLVVIILRGGMDGLGVLQPWGDPEFATLRPGMEALRPGNRGGAQNLDGFFALHPAMSPLLPLWRSGEFGFVQAVSTPYRDKRSHFDGQGMLEAGTADMLPRFRDGWLNRMLQQVPGLEGETAYTVGVPEMLLTRGPAHVMHWSPEAALELSPQAQRLLEIVMHDDPLFRDSLADAVSLAQVQTEVQAQTRGATQQKMQKAAKPPASHQRLASFAAGKLRGDSRVAAFSLGGWDTHNRQDQTLAPALTRLSEVLLTLRGDLGPVWERTAVLAMTEFGRTARLNGTRGTDHGTAGTMLFAGGALRGGQVHGRWPGLAEANLYQRRDLMPLSDVRLHAAGVMQGLFGLSRDVLEGSVFPGLDMTAPSRLVL
ncbi:DUF1501 domain-containing protein [Sagittula sp.]|uniref:DUF1501 domain-containing protein n=1 Tax=Sagittula sp. TaxID=2038081 RepID=UPI00405877D5